MKTLKRLLCSLLVAVIIFSELPVMASAAVKYRWPLDSSNVNITSYYGNRKHPLTGKASKHSGIDVGAAKNSKVYASSGGTLYVGYAKCTHNYGKSESCGCGSGYGNYVYIKDSSGMYTYYAHLTSIAFDELIKAGVTKKSTTTKGRKIGTVKQGQIIGYVGSTGSSTGNHLHFEMRNGGTSTKKRVDPLKYVTKPASTLNFYFTAPYIDEVAPGKDFELSGTASSNYKITCIVAKISGNGKGQTVTVKPNVKSYSLRGSELDKKLDFSKLKNGNYTIKIEVTDEKGGTVTVSRKFVVKNPTSTLTVDVTNAFQNQEIKLTTGKDFTIKGEIRSNYKITYVEARIIDCVTVAIEQSVKIKPNKTSLILDSSEINSKLDFSKLPAGPYTLLIDAEDASGGKAYCSLSFDIEDAVSTLSVDMSAYPSSLNKGKSFNLIGNVASNYNITSVVGSIVNSSGNTVQSVTVKPNSKTHSIESSNINKKLKFGNLSAGTYTLKIVAKDSSGKSVAWSKNFTVKGTTSTLKVSMSAYPSSLTKGKSYNLKGSVSSNYNITSVVGSIVNSSGNTVQTVTVKPNSKTHSIESSNINKNLKFGSLSAGTYTLKIVAKDASGKSVTWSNNFTVKNVESTLSVSMSAYPLNLIKGKSFNMVGNVASNYNVTSVVGYIIDASGNTVQSVSVAPNSKSHSIESSNINKKLKFGSLSTGTYMLKIVAKDASGKTATWENYFTVKNSDSTLKVSMSSAPSSITKGKSFNLKGSITSNYKITSATGSIVNSSGKAVQTVSVTPNSASHSIESSKINKNLKFGSLAKGSYTLKIVAKDASGKSVTYTKSFKVV